MREYTLSGANITVANQLVTLLQIMPKASPDANLEFLRVFCGQAANATSNQQRIEHTTQVAAFATTAVSTTPTKQKQVDAASGIAGATTIAAGKSGINIGTEGAGTKTTLWTDSFNVLNGYLWVPTPAETLVFPAGSLSAYTVQFPAAPTTLTGWSFGLVFREV